MSDIHMINPFIFKIYGDDYHHKSACTVDTDEGMFILFKVVHTKTGNVGDVVVPMCESTDLIETKLNKLLGTLPNDRGLNPFTSS